MPLVGSLIDVYPQKTHSITDAFAYGRRVFADAAGKYQCVQAAESRRERADPLLCLVAKQSKRFGRTRIVRLPIEQISDIGAALREPEHSRFMIDHGLKLRRSHRIRQ